MSRLLGPMTDIVASFTTGVQTTTAVLGGSLRLTVMCFLILGVGITTAGQQNNRQRKFETPPTGSRPPASQGYLRGADGVRLYYRKIGRGNRLVVFLHGGPGLDMNDGGFDLEPLALHCVLILYDQRGSGRSQLVRDAALLTPEHHVRDLEALRRHFGVKRMTLIGLSWGAGLAVLYTAEHPDRVARLLLISPMPPARVPFFGQRIEKMNAVMGKADIDRLEDIRSRYSKAGDAELKELCREKFRIIFRPYFLNVSARDHMRGDPCSGPA